MENYPKIIIKYPPVSLEILGTILDPFYVNEQVIKIFTPRHDKICSCHIEQQRSIVPLLFAA